MFNYLKKKLKGAVSSFSKQTEEDTEEKDPEEQTPTQPPKPKEPENQPSEKPPKKKQPKKDNVEEKKKPTVEKPKANEKQGFFSKISEKITTVQLTEERFEELFWDIEIALLENNVAVEVIEKIKQELQEELTTGRQARGKIDERILNRIAETLEEVLEAGETYDLLEETKHHKPLVIAAVGVNGSGKTTSLAKLAHYYQQHDKTVLLAACDTFRAAAIQQLEEHAKNLDIPIIKQEYGSDAAAVAYDAVQAAKSRGIDVVLIDTAGRLHSNTNLMDELKKVIRIAKPHHTIFVGEATTGNDCVEQARIFSESTNVDGIILSKADVDEQGGAAISMSYVTGKPILFLGVGQEYKDLVAFDKEEILRQVLAN